MKRCFLFLFFILISSNVLALSTTLQPTYDQGETFVIDLQGSILEPISIAQIQFYRGHVQVPLIFDIKRFDNHYFLYATTPNNQNNYTLFIRNIATTVNGQIVTTDFQQNFSTTNQTAEMTISPGMIVTAGSVDFTVTLNRDIPKTVSISSKKNSSVTLQPGQNLVHFDGSEFFKGINQISIDKYRTVVYSTKDATNDSARNRVLDVDPIEIRRTLHRGTKERVFSFVITNRGQFDLPELNFQYSNDRYSISPSTIKALKINESRAINVSLKEGEVPFSDTIRIFSGNESIELPLNFVYLDEDKNTTNLNITNRSQNSKLYCRELNGKICSSGEKCSGESLSALDGDCCRGTCTVDSSSSSLAWIGYSIGGIIIVVLLIVGGRYWKAKSHAKSSNGLDSKIKKLEKPF